MALTQSSTFHRVTVDFNENLGIKSITAYRNITNNGEPVWRSVEVLPTHIRNRIAIPGMYAHTEPSFAECLRRIKAGTVQLFYTFNGNETTGVSLYEATIGLKDYFGHILVHDPFYRAIQREKLPDIVPVDKLFYKYPENEDDGKPDLPSADIEDNDIQGHIKSVVSEGWHLTETGAKEAVEDASKKTLYIAVATYYKKDNAYVVDISEIPSEYTATIDYQLSIPIPVKIKKRIG